MAGRGLTIGGCWAGSSSWTATGCAGGRAEGLWPHKRCVIAGSDGAQRACSPG